MFFAMEETGTDSSKSAVLHGKYELGRLLGRGTFAKVYAAKDLKADRYVAIKVIGKEKVIQVGMMEHVKREISLMKMVKHPNIVELHEVMATKSKIYFALELVRGGELLSKIARSGRMKEDTAKFYFRQLISAIDFCHSRGVYHRDLKPENLLLDEYGNLKIADFGFSAFADDHLHADGLLYTSCGTPAYVAPEVIKKKGYDGAKADIWSCGVILYVLLAGRLPFPDDNLIAMYKKIHKGDFKCPPWFSSDARRLITRLLDPNPKTRITITKLVESPWFKKPIPNHLVQQEQEESEPCLGRWGKERPEVLNAFHIISLSEGFDLSPLFDESRRERTDEQTRFLTRESATGVISRLEEVAARAEGRFAVRKSETGVRLEGTERGRKGKLTVAAEIFPVSKGVLVVEVKRDGGDSLEYSKFYSDQLRPALRDIIWGSSNSQPTNTAA